MMSFLTSLPDFLKSIGIKFASINHLSSAKEIL